MIVQAALLLLLSASAEMAPRARFWSQAYRLCVAVASRREAACDALASVCKDGCKGDGPFRSSADLCRSFYGRVLLSKALISHDPSALARCLKKGPDMGEREVSQWQRKGLCTEVLTQGEKDPDAACARSIKANYSVATPVTKSCAKGIRDYWGLSGLCDPEALLPTGPEGGTHEAMTCLAADAAADFRKPKCGADPLCRAMRGEGPKACEPYRARLKDSP